MAKAKTKAKKKSTPRNVRVIKPKGTVQDLRLDLGCGPNKQPGHIGVDSVQFPGVDVVADLTKPWPWKDDSVDEVFSSHFLEHLTNPQRVHFWNEMYRVLKVGKQARVIAPYFSHACAYGDPTHQWPPVTEWAVYYVNKAWRDVNAPHTGLTCDFDWQYTGSWDPWLANRNQEFVVDHMQHNINSFRDITFIVTKRDPAAVPQTLLSAPGNTGG